MRIMFILLITFGGIAASFVDALYGLITYAFWSYAYPEKIAWGLLPLGRLSYVVGVVLVATTVFQRRKLFVNDPKIIPIIIFCIWCVISGYTISGSEFAIWHTKYFVRSILITLIITVLISDLKKFRYYLWAIALFIGLISAKSGIMGTLKGYVGSAGQGYGGAIDDRNFMAILLCITIPVVFYLGNNEHNKWLRRLLRVTFIGDILALILTYARAGFLGMMAICIFIFSKSKRKLLATIIGITAAFVLFTYLVPSQYISRVKTIKNYDVEGVEADMSAASRIIMWRIAVEMIKDSPFTGIGFYNSDDLSGEYEDPVTKIRFPQGKSIHNTILLVAAELGLPALLLYIYIYMVAYRTLGRIIIRVRKKGLSSEIESYAIMLQVGFAGFFVSGFFVNAAFIDLPWHIIGLTIALDHISRKELLEKEPVNAAV